MKRARLTTAALAGGFFAALVTLPGLWLGTLWDNSETAYGEVAREILSTGNWIVMHENLLPWFVQPPLYFWIAAFFAQWFGAGALAMRLPSALAAIAAGALLAGSVARLAGARAGIVASLVLSSCLIQAVIGRLATMDAMLDTFVLWAILAGARACGLRDDDGRSHSTALYAAAVAIALGVLTKGPVAAVVPILVVGIWVLWERRIRTLRAFPPLLAWIGACVFALGIVVPWFALLAARSGTGGVGELILHYTFGRYVGTIENQTGPVWYYLPVVVLGLFPWTAFLVPAAFVQDLGERDARGALARLTVVWAIVPLVFFSFAQTKLPNYIALTFPAYAIAIGLWFDRLVRLSAVPTSAAARAARRSAIVAAAFVPLTAGLVGAALAVFSRTMKLEGAAVLRTDLVVLGVILLVGSLATLIVVLVRRWMRAAPYVLAGTMLVWFLTLAFAGLPHAEALKPVPRLAALVNAQRRPGDAVAIMGVPGGNALVFYTHPVVDTLALPGTIPTNGAKDARTVICGAPRALVVTPRVPPDPTWGRRRTVLAVDGKDALTLYDGPKCTP